MGDSNSTDYTQENLRIGKRNREVSASLARAMAGKGQVPVPIEERDEKLAPKTAPRMIQPAFVGVIVGPAEQKRADQERIAALQATARVRDLSNQLDVKPSDLSGPKKPGKQKPEKQPRAVKAPPIDPRQAIVRGINSPAPIKPLSEGAKLIDSLPGINSESIQSRTQALSGAKQSSQVALRFEGVRVGVVSPKNKLRQPDPLVPTWILFQAEQEIQLPHDFPVRSFIAGVDVLRLQAAHVGRMLRESTIDCAILAMPVKDGEEHGKQWAHVPARSELISCDSSGRVLPTREIAGIEAKETKPDGANYQVCYILGTKAGVQSLETWTHSEAQARSVAMGLMGDGAYRVCIVSATKPLTPEMYPLTMGETMTGRPMQCWTFDGSSATLTRQGFALLGKGSISTEVEIEKERRLARLPNIWTKKHPQHNGPWMRSAKTDKATFSHG